MRTNYYALVEEYLPQTNEDKAIRDSILNYIQRNREAVLTREDPMAHMTASTVILNEAATKMLMIHHRIYDAWTWQGGHADGEEDLLHVAIKEAKEETGLSHFSPVISRNGALLYRLDILPVKGHLKNGFYVSPHLHLNAAFVLIAKEEEECIVNEAETKGIEWVLLEDIDVKADEPDITPIYHKLISEAKKNRCRT